ncbi:hypothetical protein LPB140_10840 [Sphingorhabdus lutea]|uniref:Uncharacterized protein n=1 Tax=Sphingorhabdus lutea TaxID=1913578 RepID=A0A1L3JDK1_9SPHN|nr:hypothetical protein LPB140_10840 [Sphingorhabdus lutea]
MPIYHRHKIRLSYMHDFKANIKLASTNGDYDRQEALQTIMKLGVKYLICSIEKGPIAKP